MKNKEKSFISKYKFDVIFILAVALVSFLISSNYSALYIKGNSMYPTFNDKDTLILSKEKNHINENIIVFTSPESWSPERRKFIKRIIASEGDTVKINDKEVVINGETIIDTTEKKCGIEREVSIKLQEGNYFVMGDNHAASNDSLTQFCNGNSDFFVSEDEIILSGKQLTIIGGFLN